MAVRTRDLQAQPVVVNRPTVMNYPGFDMMHGTSGGPANRAAYAFGQYNVGPRDYEQGAISIPKQVDPPTAAEGLEFVWKQRSSIIVTYVEEHIVDSDFVSLAGLDGEFTDDAEKNVLTIRNLGYAASAYGDTMPLPTPMTTSDMITLTLPSWAVQVDKTRVEHEEAEGERARFKMRLANATRALYVQCEAYNRLVLENHVPYMALVMVQSHKKFTPNMSIAQENQLYREIMNTWLMIGNKEQYSIDRLLSNALAVFADYKISGGDLRIVVPAEALTQMFTRNGDQLLTVKEVESIETIRQEQNRAGSLQIDAPSGLDIKLKHIVLPGRSASVYTYTPLRIPDKDRTEWENMLNLGGFARAIVDPGFTYTSRGERDIMIADTTSASRKARLSFLDIVGHCGIWKPYYDLISELRDLPGHSAATAITPINPDGMEEAGNEEEDGGPSQANYEKGLLDPTTLEASGMTGAGRNGTFLPFQNNKEIVEEFVVRNVFQLLLNLGVARANVNRDALVELLVPVNRRNLSQRLEYYLREAGPREKILALWWSLPMDTHILAHQMNNGFFAPLDFYVLRGSLQMRTMPAFVFCGKVGMMWVGRACLDNVNSVGHAYYYGRMSLISGAGVLQQQRGLQVPHFYGTVARGGGAVWIQPGEYTTNMQQTSGDIFSKFVGVCGKYHDLENNGEVRLSMSGADPSDTTYKSYEKSRLRKADGSVLREAKCLFSNLIRPEWEEKLTENQEPIGVNAASSMFYQMWSHGFVMHKGEQRLVPTEAEEDVQLGSYGSPDGLKAIMSHHGRLL